MDLFLIEIKYRPLISINQKFEWFDVHNRKYSLLNIYLVWSQSKSIVHIAFYTSRSQKMLSSLLQLQLMCTEQRVYLLFSLTVIATNI